MSKIDDGGPAFDLRDYFSAHADVSAYTPIETFERANGRKPTILELAKYIANIRMIEADAMLAAREAGNPEQQQTPGWIEWNGGECPVPKWSKFWIKFRDGHACDAGTGDGLVWHHEGTSADIIAYRIVSNGDQK